MSQRESAIKKQMWKITFFIDKPCQAPHNYAVECIKHGRSRVGKPQTLPARTDTQVDHKRSHFEPGRFAAAAGADEAARHASHPVSRHRRVKAGENGGGL